MVVVFSVFLFLCLSLEYLSVYSTLNQQVSDTLITVVGPLEMRVQLVYTLKKVHKSVAAETGVFPKQWGESQG